MVIARNMSTDIWYSVFCMEYFWWFVRINIWHDLLRYICVTFSHLYSAFCFVSWHNIFFIHCKVVWKHNQLNDAVYYYVLLYCCLSLNILLLPCFNVVKNSVKNMPWRFLQYFNSFIRPNFIWNDASFDWNITLYAYFFHLINCPCFSPTAAWRVWSRPLPHLPAEDVQEGEALWRVQADCEQWGSHLQRSVQGRVDRLWGVLH